MLQVSSFGDFAEPLRDLYIERLQRSIPFRWQQISIRRLPDERSNKLLVEEEKFLEKH